MVWLVFFAAAAAAAADFRLPLAALAAATGARTVGAAPAPWLPFLAAAAQARTWSAAPLSSTQTRATTSLIRGQGRFAEEATWEDLEGLRISIRTTKRYVLLAYHVGLEAAYDAAGSEVITERFDPLTGGTLTQRRTGPGSWVESGRIQVRFLVDGIPIRDGAAHVSATLTNKARVKLESIVGHALLQPGNATRDIRVQWKASGQLLWASSPSLSDGHASGRVLAATAHDDVYAVSALTPTALTKKDWNAVSDTFLEFNVTETTAVRFGYALTIAAAAPGPTTLASPLTADDYVQARIVVDGRPSVESVATLGTKERAAAIAGVLSRDVVLSLKQGNHSVALEWRRAGNSPRLWRNDPTSLDGFGASRLLYASLSDYGVDAVKHAQVLSGLNYQRAKSTEEWATVEADALDRKSVV